MAVSNGDTEYECKLSSTKQATVKMFKGKTQVWMSLKVIIAHPEVWTTISLHRESYFYRKRLH